jgi:hypothetical protein
MGFKAPAERMAHREPATGRFRLLVLSEAHILDDRWNPAGKSIVARLYRMVQALCGRPKFTPEDSVH